MATALVIDDHPVTHLGCDPILREAGFDDVLEAANSEAGCRLTAEQKPELIILDIELPDITGLAIVERLRSHAPKTKILVFSMHDDPIFAACALGAGAQGYVTKTAPPEDFVTAIRIVRGGGTYLDHALATELAVLKSQGKASPLVNLSPREMQVLQLVGRGKSHGEIAGQLNIGYKTVVNICAQLKSKLGADTLLDLVRIAVEQTASNS